jgi:hypothetical protein
MRLNELAEKTIWERGHIYYAIGLGGVSAYRTVLYDISTASGAPI